MVCASITVALSLLAAISGASAKEARKLAAAPSPCLYDENGGVGAWTGNCGLNPAFLASQKPFAPLAKFEALAGQYVSACAKHSVASGKAADFAACAADKANACYIAGKPGAYTCGSQGSALAFAKLKIGCPGTPYEQYEECLATVEGDCKGNCVWRADLADDTFKAGRIAVGPGFQQYGYCIALSLNASIPDKKAWYSNTLLSPTDPVAYAKIRGTCDYAKNGLKRFQYDNSCRKPYETAVGGLMLGTGSIYTDKYDLTGIDSKLATQCLVAGCTISYIPSSVIWGYKQDFFQCDTNPNIRYALGYYDVVKDAKLLAAVRVCSDPSIVFNKALCNAATL